MKVVLEGKGLEYPIYLLMNRMRFSYEDASLLLIAIIDFAAASETESSSEGLKDMNFGL